MNFKLDVIASAEGSSDNPHSSLTYATTSHSNNIKHWFSAPNKQNSDTFLSNAVKLSLSHILTTVPSSLHLLRPVIKHTPNCVTASWLAAMLTATPHAE